MTRLAALLHVLTDVLEDTEHGKPWCLICHELNITNVVSFTCLTRLQLAMTFDFDPAGGMTYQAAMLDEAEIDTLADVQEWVCSNKHSLTADWLARTPDDFSLFQNGLLPSPTGVSAAAQTAAAPAPPPGGNPAPVVPITSLTSYGLKHDLKDYPEIKECYMFNSWMDAVRTVAIMHNSDNALDPDYVPVTDVEIAIFWLDKTYMYAVAAKMVKYPSEAFVDTWLTKASQLDGIRLTPLPDDEKKTLFVEAVKHHPIAIAAIQQQEGIEKAMKRQFPNQVFNHTFDNLIDDIRMTCQQFDNVQGHKTQLQNNNPKKRATQTYLRAKRKNRHGTKNTRK
jgi:hypothetical protein